MLDKLPLEACLKLAAALGVEEFCGLMGWEILEKLTHRTVLLIPREQQHHWKTLANFYRWVDCYFKRHINEELHQENDFNEELWEAPTASEFEKHYPLWIKPQ